MLPAAIVQRCDLYLIYSKKYDNNNVNIITIVVIFVLLIISLYKPLFSVISKITAAMKMSYMGLIMNGFKLIYKNLEFVLCVFYPVSFLVCLLHYVSK